MDKETIESLYVGILDYRYEDDEICSFPNQQQIINKVNELIDKFNKLVEVVANANSTNK